MVADIDVIIPNYNGEKYLNFAVNSAVSQTLKPNKIFIVDDGSSDSSRKIIQDYEAQYPGWVIGIYKDNGGASSARNAALAVSTSHYVAFLDSDDEWRPEKLEKQMDVFLAGEEKLGVVYCNYSIISACGKPKDDLVFSPTKKGDLFHALLFEAYPLSGSASAVIIKREFIDQIGFFDEDLFLGEDWDFWIRLAKVCHYDYSREALVRIRAHNESSQRRPDPDRLYKHVRQHAIIYNKWFDGKDFPLDKLKYFRKEICKLCIPYRWDPLKIRSIYCRLAGSQLEIERILFKSELDFWGEYIKVFTALALKKIDRIFSFWVRYLLIGGNVIRVRLGGGLGNQMFQYAAACSLARRNDSALLLDISAYKEYKVWPYGLDSFNLSSDRVVCRGFLNGKSLLAHNFRKIWHFCDRKIGLLYAEPHYHVDNTFWMLESPVEIAGYFQSAKYFNGIRDELLKDFVLREPFSTESAGYKQKIESSAMPVSLHVRRGDYVSNAAALETHGTSSPDYYRQAIELIREKSGTEPHFFIFSDDPEYVQEAFAFLEYKTIVRGADRRPHEDMHLMALCRHHIIANSTFSWWGAWLNPKEDKIVIAPKQWFSPVKMKENNTKDLYPEDWIVL